MKNKRDRSRERRSHSKASAVKGHYCIDSLSAVYEYLRLRPEVVINVFATANDIESMKREVVKQGLSSEIVMPVESSQYSSTCAVVKLREKKWDVFIEELDGPGNDMVMMLDHITDPRNLGAIIRTCAFFGVSSVIVASNRQVLFSQASVSTAMGGFALVDLIVVSSLASSLSALKESGYQVYGADQDAGQTLLAGSEGSKRVLVLGSEQSGLSKSVKEQCDGFVTIEGSTDSLESLNVSVAAGILLHSLTVS